MPTHTIDLQMPLILRNFENCLRSGYNLKQTLEIIAKDVPAPAGADVQQVVNEINRETSILTALDNWLKRTPSADLDLLIATVRVQLEVGGNLADKINLLGQIMTKRSLSAR